VTYSVNGVTLFKTVDLIATRGVAEGIISTNATDHPGGADNTGGIFITPTPDPNAKQSPLKGSKVIIGITITVVVILILLVVLFMIRRAMILKRKRERAERARRKKMEAQKRREEMAKRGYLYDDEQ
jgi:heme exporter protein D